MSMIDLLLLLVPGLPLLLVLPLLRRFVPRVEYAAILPTVFLLILPGEHFVEFSWLLFNAGFGFIAETRLLLLMAVLLWLPAAFFLSTSKSNGDRLASEYSRIFFLLTLSGYLGVILSTDIVSFFTFSTLMGYGFYGLLVHTGDDAVKRAGRIYLYFMVLADLLLFEAVLIAASVSEEQNFDSVRESIVDSPLSGLYLVLVVLGFALKAGVWPFHFWLPLAFRSARLPAVLLLAAVPVAIGMLGIIRWLPLGEFSLPVPGMIIQGLGWVAIAYAIISWLLLRELKTLPAYITIFTTGLFIIVIGASLNSPDTWKQYAGLVIYLILLLVFIVVLLTSAIAWRESGKPFADKSLKAPEMTAFWFERWSSIIIRQGGEMALETLLKLRASCLAMTEPWSQIDFWKMAMQAGEFILQRWYVAVMLFLFVSIMTAFLVVF